MSKHKKADNAYEELFDWDPYDKEAPSSRNSDAKVGERANDERVQGEGERWRKRKREGKGGRREGVKG